MLVFGIATAVTTVHRVLPHAVSSVLAIERFQSQPSHICVLEIINKVILNYIEDITRWREDMNFIFECGKNNILLTRCARS